MEASEQRNWAEGLDIHLLQRLWRRAVRPGLVNLKQADAIIARFKGMATKQPLAEHLNRRWQPVDEQAASSPIVFVKPRPIEFNVTSAIPNKPAKAPSRKKSDRARAKGKSPDQPASPLAMRSEAAGPGARPGAPESHGVDSQTILVQRKAAAAPSTPPMPVVSPNVVANSPAIPNFPLGADAKAEAGKISKLSTPTLAGVHTANPQSTHLPMAPTEAERSTPPTKVTEASVATPAPVVPPTSRLESTLSELVVVAPQRVQRHDRAQVSASTPELRRTNADAVTSANSVVQPRAEFWSPPTVLPIVREHIVTQASSARIDQRKPLPLARETAPAGQQMPGKSDQPMRSAPAAAKARHSRQQSTIMPPIRRLGAAQNELGASAASPPKSADVDVDGIVNKVERRFMRRLTVEAERRRATRWP